jgi:hypothetical protein
MRRETATGFTEATEKEAVSFLPVQALFFIVSDGMKVLRCKGGV